MSSFRGVTEMSKRPTNLRRRSQLPSSEELRSTHWLFAANAFDRKLVADFLFLYARAEYALRAAGFTLEIESKPVRTNWSKFAEQLTSDPAAEDNPELERAVRYLKAFPPKTFRVRWDRSIRERETSRDNSTNEFLLRAVGDVRNNLFHGGKDLAGSAIERDEKLIKAAFIVLAWALQTKEDVWGFFNEPGLGPLAAQVVSSGARERR